MARARSPGHRPGSASGRERPDDCGSRRGDPLLGLVFQLFAQQRTQLGGPAGGFRRGLVVLGQGLGGLGFATVDSSLGVLVLSALLAGAVAGGLILSLGVIVPLRRKLERLRMQAAAPSSPQDTGA